MDTGTDIDLLAAELRESFVAVQQPRDDFKLAHFVVGSHETPAMCWHQCVLELHRHTVNMKRALIKRQILECQIDDLRARGDRIGALRADEKALDLEEMEMAYLGTRREFETLLGLYRAFGRTYSHEEIQAQAADYWAMRLVAQARRSLETTGSVGLGNLEAMQQANIEGWDDDGRALHTLPTALDRGPRPAPLLPG